MNKRIVIGAGTATAIIAAGVTVALAQTPSDNPSAEAASHLPSLVEQHQTHPWVRAHGLDPAQAKLALTTPSGLTVAKVSDARVACLMASDNDDQCYAASNITAGRGYSITNDCSRGSNRAMRIMGVAPPGVAQIKVRYSSGAGLVAKASSDVFLIEGTTPARNQPYPIEMQYLDAQGTITASDPIPGGDDLCLERASTTR